MRTALHLALAVTILGITYVNLLAAQEPDGEIREVILLHTNDQHFNFKHLEAMEAKVARFRNQYEDVFLFDAGDFTIRPRRWSQREIVNNAEEYEQQFKFMINAMNTLGYDVAVLGNHELAYHTTITRDVLKMADFPMLGANVNVTTENFITPVPFITLQTKSGINLAVLGLSGGTFDRAEGISLSDPSKTVAEHMHLRDHSHAFILLTHIGAKADRSLAEEYGDKIDVIIGGHSHTLLNPPETLNDVLIAQAKDGYGADQYLGVIRLIFSADGQLVDKQGEVLTFRERNSPSQAFLPKNDEAIQLRPLQSSAALTLDVIPNNERINEKADPDKRQQEDVEQEDSAPFAVEFLRQPNQAAALNNDQR